MSFSMAHYVFFGFFSKIGKFLTVLQSLIRINDFPDKHHLLIFFSFKNKAWLWSAFWVQNSGCTPVPSTKEGLPVNLGFGRQICLVPVSSWGRKHWTLKPPLRWWCSVLLLQSHFNFLFNKAKYFRYKTILIAKIYFFLYFLSEHVLM